MSQQDPDGTSVANSHPEHNSRFGWRAHLSRVLQPRKMSAIALVAASALLLGAVTCAVVPRHLWSYLCFIVPLLFTAGCTVINTMATKKIDTHLNSRWSLRKQGNLLLYGLIAGTPIWWQQLSSNKDQDQIKGHLQQLTRTVTAQTDQVAAHSTDHIQATIANTKLLEQARNERMVDRVIRPQDEALKELQPTKQRLNKALAYVDETEVQKRIHVRVRAILAGDEALWTPDVTKQLKKEFIELAAAFPADVALTAEQLTKRDRIAKDRILPWAERIGSRYLELIALCQTDIEAAAKEMKEADAALQLALDGLETNEGPLSRLEPQFDRLDERRIIEHELVIGISVQSDEIKKLLRAVVTQGADIQTQIKLIAVLSEEDDVVTGKAEGALGGQGDRHAECTEAELESLANGSKHDDDDVKVLLQMLERLKGFDHLDGEGGDQGATISQSREPQRSIAITKDDLVSSRRSIAQGRKLLDERAADKKREKQTEDYDDSVTSNARDLRCRTRVALCKIALITRLARARVRFDELLKAIEMKTHDLDAAQAEVAADVQVTTRLSSELAALIEKDVEIVEQLKLINNDGVRKVQDEGFRIEACTRWIECVSTALQLLQWQHEGGGLDPTIYECMYRIRFVERQTENDHKE